MAITIHVTDVQRAAAYARGAWVQMDGPLSPPKH